MATILLVIIYISFISLGLPDSLLGPAWPAMHKDLSVPLSSAGLITMIISGGTILSSLFSARLIRRFGTGRVTAVSVFLTAFALITFFFLDEFYGLCLAAVPLGIGAGAVDAALNNFVALHYEARHMSWLHCFWGVGATAGPVVMSFFLSGDQGWRRGYLSIGLLQAALVLLLFVTLPIWKRFEGEAGPEETKEEGTGLFVLIRKRGAMSALLSCLCYCAVELTAGLWGSSYLVNYRGVAVETAAKWVSMYYFGITLGRFLSGFITVKLNNTNMIRLGEGFCVAGILVFLLPFSGYFQLAGLILIGFGCAPIYPCILHDTPNRFGKEVSQGMMGLQMASAYIGSTFMPPLLGVIAERAGIYLLPYFLLVLILLMILSSETTHRRLKKTAIR